MKWYTHQLLFVSGLLAFVFLGPGQVQAERDPVETIEEIIENNPVQHLKNGNPQFLIAGLNFYNKELDQEIQNLKTLDQMRRALIALTKLRQGLPFEITNANMEAAKKVIKRIEPRLETIIEKSKDPLEKAAVADYMEGTLEDLVKAKVFNIFSTLQSDFFKKLSQLADPKEPFSVRKSAVLALGNIYPNPQEATQIIETLAKSQHPQAKLVASEALRRMMANLRVVGPQPLVKDQNLDWAKILLPQENRLFKLKDRSAYLTALAVVPGAASGISQPQNRKQSNDRVGRISAETLKMAAEVLDVNSPPDKEINAVKNWLQRKTLILDRLANTRQLRQSFSNHDEAFAESLTHADPQVRLVVWETLELIGKSRFKFLEGFHSLPEPEKLAFFGPNLQRAYQEDYLQIENELYSKKEPLRDTLEEAKEVLKYNLSNPNVRIRRAAVDFLEIVAESADPLLDELLQTLRDPDPFVRMAVCRTLGRIVAFDIATQRTKLIETRLDEVLQGFSYLLRDRDFDVRIASALSIRWITEAAYMKPETQKDLLPKIQQGTNPALIYASQIGDEEPRLEAMSTLKVVGVDEANLPAALAALTRSLQNPDADVRKLAAETLGSLGPRAQSAIPALKRLLNDPDDSVRQAVSGALLSITP